MFFTLRFKFEKETTENSLNEGNRLMEECKALVSFHHVESNHDITYDGLPTMVDGKVLTAYVTCGPSIMHRFLSGLQIIHH